MVESSHNLASVYLVSFMRTTWTCGVLPFLQAWR